MLYNCKLIIEEDRANDNCFFDIYIKYKPLNSVGFYKKYFILNEYKIRDNTESQVEDLLYNSPSRIEKIKWFNNLSMEDIKQMVAEYIKENQTEKLKESIKEEEFQIQIKLAEEKVKKFTVEI